MEKDSKKTFFPTQLLKPLVAYLKGERKKLKETKKELKKVDPFVTGNRDSDNSVDSDVAENVEHDRAFAMRTQVAKSLIAIRKTLTRIKLGKYGICVSCGKMIDTDRLAVTPTAEYCMECAKKAEKKAAE
jgi:RNA polymerase-binding transcription factor DksA